MGVSLWAGLYAVSFVRGGLLVIQRYAVSQKDATSIPNAIWDNPELFRLQEVISLGKKGLISKLREELKK
jgi:hypothetical protein